MFRFVVFTLGFIAVCANRYGSNPYSGYQERYPTHDYKRPSYHEPKPNYQPEYTKTAHVYIDGVGNFSHVRGTLTFTQTAYEGPVTVLGEIVGLTAGLHGMHIHEKGDTGDECKAAGPHFNPFKKHHGGPQDEDRHVGDLGNIETPAYGYPTTTRVHIVDELISLSGERSIIGRAIVLHAKEDDLGRGNNEESKKTGNAGARVGCGVIVADEYH